MGVSAGILISPDFQQVPLKIRQKMKAAPLQIPNEIFNRDVRRTSPKI